MAKWKRGVSGNPHGRKAGTGKRAPLLQALDALAPAALVKLAALVKAGELAAIKIVIERCIPIPKARPELSPLNFQIPKKITEQSLAKLTDDIIRAVFEGVINVDEADKLINLLESRYSKSIKTAEVRPNWKALDPMEASRIYMQIMGS